MKKIFYTLLLFQFLLSACTIKSEYSLNEQSCTGAECETYQPPTTEEIPLPAELPKSLPLMTNKVMASKFRDIFTPPTGSIDATVNTLIQNEISYNRAMYDGNCDPYRRLVTNDCKTGPGSLDLSPSETQGKTVAEMNAGRMGFIYQTCNKILINNNALHAALLNALDALPSFTQAPTQVEVSKMVNLFYSDTVLPNNVIDLFTAVGTEARLNTSVCTASFCREPYRYVLLAVCMSPYYHTL